MISSIQRARLSEKTKRVILIFMIVITWSLAIVTSSYAEIAYTDIGGSAAGALAACLWALALIYALSGIIALGAVTGVWRVSRSPSVALAISVLALLTTLPLTIALRLSPPASGVLALTLGIIALVIALIWIEWSGDELKPGADDEPGSTISA